MKINRLRSAALAMLLLCASLTITADGWADQASAVQVRLVVKVGDRQKAADRLARSAEKSKGYFLENLREYFSHFYCNFSCSFHVLFSSPNYLLS